MKRGMTVAIAPEMLPMLMGKSATPPSGIGPPPSVPVTTVKTRSTAAIDPDSPPKSSATYSVQIPLAAELTGDGSVVP